MQAARLVMGGLILVGCSCAAPPPSPGTTPPTEPIPSELDASSQRRLQLASLILSSGSEDVDQAARTAAAAELAALELPQSREVLAQAVHSERLEVLRAALEAMVAAPRLDPAMRGPLLERVRTAPPEVQDVLAELLARHGQVNGTTLGALAAIAEDATAPADARIAAVRAIAAFRHVPARAAANLAAVLQAEEAAPPNVVDTVTTQLSHLTGLPRNSDVDFWLDWWAENRDRPSERWLQDTVDALTRQAARQAQELSASEAERDRMAARILETIRDFWPYLSIEQQQERLIHLLNDELAAVRLFGLDRLAVHLRDGHESAAGQETALTLLQDTNPDVRRAVANLLPEFEPAAADAAAIVRFPAEADPVVLAALLPRIASAQPELLKAEVIGPLLSTPTVGPVAIEALHDVMSDPARQPTIDTVAILPAVRATFNQKPAPRSGALLALLGDQSDLHMLEQRLDDENAEWRTAIADAMLTRGVTAPLHARASDPAIYPVAIRSARQRGDLEALRTIAGMTPPQPHADLWSQALLETAQGLPTTDALAADDILIAAGSTPAERAALLRAAYTAEDLPPDTVAPLASRLAPLVLETGDPRAAYGLLDRVADSDLTDTLRSLKFEAAMRGRLYDDAASVDGTPTAWIGMYESLRDGQPDAAELLRTEIVRRFQDVLDDTMRERLGVAADPMMGTADQDAPPG
ncbi:MAG: hypothetical protein QF733_00330 [Phycisphaerales bacterium]|jgi:hypothetical protein|nr:hypothetical protein [Phycisphaerales bacterium]